MSHKPPRTWIGAVWIRWGVVGLQLQSKASEKGGFKLVTVLGALACGGCNFCVPPFFSSFLSSFLADDNVTTSPFASAASLSLCLCLL